MKTNLFQDQHTLGACEGAAGNGNDGRPRGLLHRLDEHLGDLGSAQHAPPHFLLLRHLLAFWVSSNKKKKSGEKMCLPIRDAERVASVESLCM